MSAVIHEHKSSPVEEVAINVGRQVQQSFARLLAVLPGRLGRASDLQRCLQVDPKLAWNVFNVAKASDPLVAIRHIPSMTSIRRVIAAAEARGVAHDVLAAVVGAVGEFEVVGRKYADGRVGFTSMIASMTDDHSAEASALQSRRAAYRANAQLWGTQISVSLSQGAVRRGADGTLITSSVQSRNDFRRLRASARPAIHGNATLTRNGEMITPLQRPINLKADAEYGIPLLPDFCSKPIPEFGRTEMLNGYRVHFMQGEHLGKLGAIDLTTATCYEADLLYLPATKRNVFLRGLTFRIPTELCVVELLVHRPTLGQITVHSSIIPEVGCDYGVELDRSVPQLLTYERVQSLGPLPQAPPVSELRRYDALTHEVLHGLQWVPEEFDVHRLTLAYPLLNTVAALWFEVAE